MHGLPILRLCWKLELFAFQNFRNVEIEEIAIQNGLNDARDDSDDVVESLVIVSVDPVEDVESSVRSEGEEIVRSDGLSLAGFRDHKQLGKDSDGLQVDRESPQDFHRGEFVVQDQGQNRSGTEEKFNPKSVVVMIVGGLELEIHEIDGADGGGEEEDFHRGVVEGDEIRDQVQIAGDEDDSEEDLGSARNTGARSGLPNLE